MDIACTSLLQALSSRKMAVCCDSVCVCVFWVGVSSEAGFETN